MVETKELIPRVRDFFGLNSYEAKIWLALLKKGIASAGELASISGVPRSRTYDTLESLKKKGFASIRLGKPVKYVRVSPQAVIARLKEKTKKEFEETLKKLSRIRLTKEFAQLEEICSTELSKSSEEEKFVELIKGKLNISNQIKKLLYKAKKEVLICMSSKELGSKLKLFEQTFAHLRKKGVKISLFLSGDPQIIKKIEAKLKIRARHISIETKLFIADKKEMLLYMPKESAKKPLIKDSAILISSDFLSNSFLELLEKAANNKSQIKL